jgi:hypothetical protein
MDRKTTLEDFAAKQNVLLNITDIDGIDRVHESFGNASPTTQVCVDDCIRVVLSVAGSRSKFTSGTVPDSFNDLLVNLVVSKCADLPFPSPVPRVRFGSLRYWMIFESRAPPV